MKNYFSQLKAVLFHPADFFTSVAADAGYAAPMKFASLSVLIGGLISVMVDVLILRPSGFGLSTHTFSGDPLPTGLDPTQPWMFFLLVCVAAALAPIGIFISAGISHLFVRLFKGRGNYNQTVKIFAYAVAPSVFNVIPLVSGIWSAVIAIAGFKKLHSFSSGRAVMVYLSPLLAMLALVLLAFFVLMIAAPRA